MPVAIIIPIVEAVFKYAPGAVVALRELFAKDQPTEADWAALKAKLQGMEYQDYVPDSALPK